MTPQSHPIRDDAVLPCLAAVAAAWRVPVGLVASAARGTAREAFARHVAIYVAHVGLGLSYAAAGARFGRDPTTVAYACRRIEDARERRPLDRALDHLEAALRLHGATRFAEVRA